MRGSFLFKRDTFHRICQLHLTCNFLFVKIARKSGRLEANQASEPSWGGAPAFFVSDQFHHFVTSMTRSPTARSLLATTILPNSSSRAISNTFIGTMLTKTPPWLNNSYGLIIYPLRGDIKLSKWFQFFSLRHLFGGQLEISPNSSPTLTESESVVELASPTVAHPHLAQPQLPQARLLLREQWRRQESVQGAAADRGKQLNIFCLLIMQLLLPHCQQEGVRRC